MRKIIFLILLMFLPNIIVYAYREYRVGNIIKYNDTYFYVIKKSNSDENTVTLLKMEPLTVDEVNEIIPNAATGYPYWTWLTKYGKMGFKLDRNCPNSSNCSVSYEQSDAKYVVDNWSNNFFGENNVKSARLISLNDLSDSLNLELNRVSDTEIEVANMYSVSWLFDSTKTYETVYFWTMDQNDRKSSHIWTIGNDGIKSKTF